jgi:hypothetical protein
MATLNTPDRPNIPLRTLGEMPVLELLKGAKDEAIGLSNKLHEMGITEAQLGTDGLVVQAYIGSILGRLANIEMKLQG